MKGYLSNYAKDKENAYFIVNGEEIIAKPSIYVPEKTFVEGYMENNVFNITNAWKANEEELMSFIKKTEENIKTCKEPLFKNIEIKNQNNSVYLHYPRLTDYIKLIYHTPNKVKFVNPFLSNNTKNVNYNNITIDAIIQKIQNRIVYAILEDFVNLIINNSSKFYYNLDFDNFEIEMELNYIIDDLNDLLTNYNEDILDYNKIENIVKKFKQLVIEHDDNPILQRINYELLYLSENYANYESIEELMDELNLNNYKIPKIISKIEEIINRKINKLFTYSYNEKNSYNLGNIINLKIFAS